MNVLLDSFTEFWEILTGVFDDNRARLIRLSCFTLLAFGVAWAAINYFKADKISDTDVEFYSPSQREARGDSAALKKMADLARTVQEMKQGGEAIAAAIAARHSKPFNIDGYNEMGLENLGEGGEFFSQSDSTIQIPGETSLGEDNSAEPEILVKAVMLSKKNARAIIDTATEKNKIIKRGENIDGFGRVTRIRKKGITVRINRQDVDFNIAAFPKAAMNKKDEAKKTNLGVEEFLFEGTVPKDSPLAPTTERATTN